MIFGLTSLPVFCFMANLKEDARAVKSFCSVGDSLWITGNFASSLSSILISNVLIYLGRQACALFFFASCWVGWNTQRINSLEQQPTYPTGFKLFSEPLCSWKQKKSVLWKTGKKYLHWRKQVFHILPPISMAAGKWEDAEKQKFLTTVCQKFRKCTI